MFDFVQQFLPELQSRYCGPLHLSAAVFPSLPTFNLFTIKGRELGDEDGRPVIEARVEALEDALWREVELVKNHPVSSLQRCKEGAVLPGVRARRRAIDG